MSTHCVYPWPQVEEGKLIQSMNLTGNVYAEGFKQFLSNPLQVMIGV